MSPTSVAAGSPSTVTTILTGPAPAGGAVISLASNNTAVIVPATVTVSAGSTAGTFNVTTTTANGSVNAIITATYNSTTQTAALAVTPNFALASLTVSPTTVNAGSTATATVTLTGAAPAGGVTVSLTELANLCPPPCPAALRYRLVRHPELSRSQPLAPFPSTRRRPSAQRTTA